MTNTLQNWYNNGNISYSEKQRLNTMGVNDYDYHYLQDLRKMLECEAVAQRCLYVPGKVHQINFFSTWFNNNCATVICGEYNNHDLRLVIHEPRQGGMAEEFESRQITSYLNYGEARNRADNVESGLNGSNPILQIHTGIIDAFAHAYQGIDLRELPMIKKTYLTTNSNPDTQLKPFDIVRRPIQGYSKKHSAIYLGNGQVAQVYSAGGSFSGASSAFSVNAAGGGPLAGSRAATERLFGSEGAHIGSWESFLAGTTGTIERYHPLIPYKNQDGTDGIKEHIARAVSSEEYAKNQYSLTGIFQGERPNEGNCQHFSNRCVLGLNFSEEGTKFKKKVPLAEEIADTDRLFDNLTTNSRLSSNKIEVDSAVDSWRRNYQQGQKFEAKIEVRPNPPCKIQ